MEFRTFLTTHKLTTEYKEANIKETHTRIGCKKTNVYPGSFLIGNGEENEKKVELAEFHQLYYNYVFEQNQPEYLTECQHNNGPLVVDLDFRFPVELVQRQYTFDHINRMVALYLMELKCLFDFSEPEFKPFNIYIFEKSKPNLNEVETKQYVKDGIHMLVGMKVNRMMQQWIRRQMLTQFANDDVWKTLPVINTWEKILDEGISTGTTNWQMYGSKKPDNEAYKLTYCFNIRLDPADNELQQFLQELSTFSVKANFSKLSVQYWDNPEYKVRIHPEIQTAYNSYAAAFVDKRKPKMPQIVAAQPSTFVQNPSTVVSNALITDIIIDNIGNAEQLGQAVHIMEQYFLKQQNYEALEVHRMTQILPPMYYEPGSHLLNRQVAFALKNTHVELFYSWVLLRSKASDFDYSTIPDLFRQWNNYFNKSSAKEGVTKRSLIYWARKHNLAEYEKIRKETIDSYLEEGIYSLTEYDFAVILKHMFKDKYVCTNIKQKTWYHFKQHHWVLDKGYSLRDKISTELYEVFRAKAGKVQQELFEFQNDEVKSPILQKKIKTIGEIQIKLKTTHMKDNIMREAAELFYDDQFYALMDTNKYLMGFNNGVIDFKQKQFREGLAEDYITMSTNLDYLHVDWSQLTAPNIVQQQEINHIMQQLFPVEDLRKYMWEHLASCLIGASKNQTFNVYHGSGSNGKSILTELMSKAFGDYKGTVPITLVTTKRGQIGGTSDEVIKLKGKRYAVMQEPTKGVKLNEGVMKEITSGDPLQARGLYCESEVFDPQFNLVVCTNNLFDIESNDDGTWRRIRKIDFLSKFKDADEMCYDDTPYVYDKDKDLKEKLPLYAPLFMSMLVKIAFETDGIVKECATVTKASLKYRNSQDFIASFVAERVIHTKDKASKIGKQGLWADFRNWVSQEFGERKLPKRQEIYDYMDRKFGGTSSNKGWVGVEFVPMDEEDEDGDGDGDGETVVHGFK